MKKPRKRRANTGHNRPRAHQKRSKPTRARRAHTQAHIPTLKLAALSGFFDLDDDRSAFTLLMAPIFIMAFAIATNVSIQSKSRFERFARPHTISTPAPQHRLVLQSIKPIVPLKPLAPASYTHAPFAISFATSPTLKLHTTHHALAPDIFPAQTTTHQAAIAIAIPLKKGSLLRSTDTASPGNVTQQIRTPDQKTAIHKALTAPHSPSVITHIQSASKATTTTATTATTATPTLEDTGHFTRSISSSILKPLKKATALTPTRPAILATASEITPVRIAPLPPPTTARNAILPVHTATASAATAAAAAAATLTVITLIDRGFYTPTHQENICVASKSPAQPAEHLISNIKTGKQFGVALAHAARAQTESFVIYNDRYMSIKFPMGDVPSLYGVCTDVIIRAYRALGIDLQELVYASRLGSGDRSINHRRTRTLKQFFKRSGETIAITSFPENYLPGDIITYYRPQNRGSNMHIAIVADVLAPSGRPMIIHNRGWGPQMEDALFVDKITGHFRYTGPRKSLAQQATPQKVAASSNRSPDQ